MFSDTVGSHGSSNFKMYIITEPFYRPGSGDSDYVEGLCELLDRRAEYIRYRNYQSQGRYCRKWWEVALRKYVTKREVDFSEENRRKEIVESLFKEILDDNSVENDKKILNLQIRPPETGMMVFPNDLSLFRETGVKIVITCHEYELNHYRKNFNFNEKAQLYFEVADRVIFFNEQDMMQAASEHHGGSEKLLSKSMLSQVVTTLTLDAFDATRKQRLSSAQERPPNILMFGSIREGKGFKNEIVQLVRKLPIGRELYLVGEPRSSINVARLLMLTFCKKDLHDFFYFYEGAQQGAQQCRLSSEYFALQELERLIFRFRDDKEEMQRAMERLERKRQYGRSSPIRLVFYASPKELADVCMKCRYAYLRDDTKGFSYNASAMITLLAYGCILFVNSGHCTSDTPKDLLQICSSVLDVSGRICALEANPDMMKEVLEKQAAVLAGRFVSSVIEYNMLACMDFTSSIPDVCRPLPEMTFVPSYAGMLSTQKGRKELIILSRERVDKLKRNLFPSEGAQEEELEHDEGRKKHKSSEQSWRKSRHEREGRSDEYVSSRRRHSDSEGIKERKRKHGDESSRGRQESSDDSRAHGHSGGDDRKRKKQKIRGETEVDRRWYGEEDIIGFLRRFCERDGVNVEGVAFNEATLNAGLNKILNEETGAGQFIIPMNIHVLFDRFVPNENTHWVGLLIEKNEDGNITRAQYVNPMGFALHDVLKRHIEKAFGVAIEEVFNIENRPQYAVRNEVMVEEGNQNDCGPFLVDTMRQLVAGEEPVYRGMFLKDSLALGCKLRQQQQKILHEVDLGQQLVEDEENPPPRPSGGKP